MANRASTPHSLSLASASLEIVDLCACVSHTVSVRDFLCILYQSKNKPREREISFKIQNQKTALQNIMLSKCWKGFFFIFLNDQ